MLKQIENLVHTILRGHETPWPTEITDSVFLAIEGNPGWLELYWDVVQELDAQGKNGRLGVNSYIGRRVKQLTTGVNRGRCYSPVSSLIQSYEKH